MIAALVPNLRPKQVTSRGALVLDELDFLVRASF